MKDQQFYSTAAQVIPVFVLALAFEFRFFERRETTVGQGLFVLSLLVALAGGELLALWALLTDEAERFTKPMVLAGLFWGAIGLFTPLLLPTLRGLAQDLPHGLVRAVRIGWPLAFLAVNLVALVTASAAVIPGAIFALWIILVCAWFVVSSSQEAGSLRAQVRDGKERAERGESAVPPDVSPTVSPTKPPPAERSATERN